MPISLSAKKSLRKSLKNRKENVLLKTKVKKIIKDFLLKPTEDKLKIVQSIIDKAVKHNIFHKNKASRLKSRLEKKVSAKEVVTKMAVVKKKVAAKKVTKSKKKMS